VKLSCGLTVGISDLEMKLPSTYMLTFPGKKVYFAFLTFAYENRKEISDMQGPNKIIDQHWHVERSTGTPL
jgi:hypothetical protein